ncbi:restriction endonuclease subunit S, partial [Klebsiella pneumoniae]
MDQVWAVAGGSDTFPYVSLGEQRKLAIHFPTIEVQCAIGRVLRSLDDKIELNRKTAATLEEMARALYRSWF